jgi:hypothetical protein
MPKATKLKPPKAKAFGCDVINPDDWILFANLGFA